MDDRKIIIKQEKCDMDINEDIFDRCLEYDGKTNIKKERCDMDIRENFGPHLVNDGKINIKQEICDMDIGEENLDIYPEFDNADCEAKNEPIEDFNPLFLPAVEDHVPIVGLEYIKLEPSSSPKEDLKLSQYDKSSDSCRSFICREEPSDFEQGVDTAKEHEIPDTSTDLVQREYDKSSDGCRSFIYGEEPSDFEQGVATAKEHEILDTSTDLVQRKGYCVKCSQKLSVNDIHLECILHRECIDTRMFIKPLKCIDCINMQQISLAEKGSFMKKKIGKYLRSVLCRVGKLKSASKIHDLFETDEEYREYTSESRPEKPQSPMLFWTDNMDISNKLSHPLKINDGVEESSNGMDERRTGAEVDKREKEIDPVILCGFPSVKLLNEDHLEIKNILREITCQSPSKLEVGTKGVLLEREVKGNLPPKKNSSDNINEELGVEGIEDDGDKTNKEFGPVATTGFSSRKSLNENDLNVEKILREITCPSPFKIRARTEGILLKEVKDNLPTKKTSSSNINEELGVKKIDPSVVPSGVSSSRSLDSVDVKNILNEIILPSTSKMSGTPIVLLEREVKVELHRVKNCLDYIKRERSVKEIDPPVETADVGSSKSLDDDTIGIKNILSEIIHPSTSKTSRTKGVQLENEEKDHRHPMKIKENIKEELAVNEILDQSLESIRKSITDINLKVDESVSVQVKNPSNCKRKTYDVSKDNAIGNYSNVIECKKCMKSGGPKGHGTINEQVNKCICVKKRSFESFMTDEIIRNKPVKISHKNSATNKTSCTDKIKREKSKHSLNERGEKNGSRKDDKKGREKSDKSSHKRSRKSKNYKKDQKERKHSENSYHKKTKLDETAGKDEAAGRESSKTSHKRSRSNESPANDEIVKEELDKSHHKKSKISENHSMDETKQVEWHKSRHKPCRIDESPSSNRKPQEHRKTSSHKRSGNNESPSTDRKCREQKTSTHKKSCIRDPILDGWKDSQIDSYKRSRIKESSTNGDTLNDSPKSLDKSKSDVNKVEFEITKQSDHLSHKNKLPECSGLEESKQNEYKYLSHKNNKGNEGKITKEKEKKQPELSLKRVQFDDNPSVEEIRGKSSDPFSRYKMNDNRIQERSITSESIVKRFYKDPRLDRLDVHIVQPPQNDESLSIEKMIEQDISKGDIFIDPSIVPIKDPRLQKSMKDHVNPLASSYNIVDEEKNKMSDCKIRKIDYSTYKSRNLENGSQVEQTRVVHSSSAIDQRLAEGARKSTYRNIASHVPSNLPQNMNRELSSCLYNRDEMLRDVQVKSQMNYIRDIESPDQLETFPPNLTRMEDEVHQIDNIPHHQGNNIPPSTHERTGMKECSKIDKLTQDALAMATNAIMNPSSVFQWSEFSGMSPAQSIRTVSTHLMKYGQRDLALALLEVKIPDEMPEIIIEEPLVKDVFEVPLKEKFEFAEEHGDRNFIPEGFMEYEPSSSDDNFTKLRYTSFIKQRSETIVSRNHIKYELIGDIKRPIYTDAAGRRYSFLDFTFTLIPHSDFCRLDKRNSMLVKALDHHSKGMRFPINDCEGYVDGNLERGVTFKDKTYLESEYYITWGADFVTVLRKKRRFEFEKLTDLFSSLTDIFPPDKNLFSDLHCGEYSLKQKSYNVQIDNVFREIFTAIIHPSIKSLDKSHSQNIAPTYSTNWNKRAKNFKRDSVLGEIEFDGLDCDLKELGQFLSLWTGSNKTSKAGLLSNENIPHELKNVIKPLTISDEQNFQDNKLSVKYVLILANIFSLLKRKIEEIKKKFTGLVDISNSESKGAMSELDKLTAAVNSGHGFALKLFLTDFISMLRKKKDLMSASLVDYEKLSKEFKDILQQTDMLGPGLWGQKTLLKLKDKCKDHDIYPVEKSQLTNKPGNLMSISCKDANYGYHGGKRSSSRWDDRGGYYYNW